MNFPPPDSPAALRVLIVEDNDDDRVLLTRELRQGGFDPQTERVETAGDFSRALLERDWDLILCDFRMPKFSGHQALDLLRASNLDIPFILISGTVGEEVAVESMKAGASDYLLKDNLTRLIPAVRRELREAESRRQQRFTQQALNESQSLLSSVYNNASDNMALFQVDPPGEYRLISVNRVAFATAAALGLGWSETDVLGLTLREILRDYLHYDEARIAATYAKYQIALDTRLPQAMERTFPVEGQSYYFEELLIPLPEQVGRNRFLLWSARNVTERRRGEAERQRLEQQFQESQKLESLGLLAGGIAHDFNNLLTAILNYTGVGLEKLPFQAEGREELSLIHTAATMAAGLTRELLAYSGKGTVLEEPINLSKLLREMSGLLKTSVSARTAIEWELEDNLPWIKADPNQLRQVILNLVLNAHEAITRQPGRIVLHTAAVGGDQLSGKWLLPISLPDQGVLLEISDNGQGMDPAVLNKIFDPFFTTKTQGRGLGLSAVLGIIRAHRGNIAVQSVANQGTTFRILLPISPQVAGETAAKPPLPAAAPARPATILIIDDNDIVRSSVAAVLKSKQYHPLLAANGRLGLELFQAHAAEIDLVILDLTMPDMSGDQVFAELRRENPDLRIILTTGHSQEDITGKLLSQPRVGFVQKASGPATLLAEVRKMLQGEGGRT